jgi:D-alanine-D-alanine ligase
MGGPSSERDISLKSGKAVYETLRSAGEDAVSIDIKTDGIKDNIRLIKSSRIDCAFIALHGRFGEDGQIQEILESLKIPYTGSGVLASKLAMDKVYSRRIFEVNGLKVPRYRVLNAVSYNLNCRPAHNLSFPLVVKPATHGSSIGLSIVDRSQDLDAAVALAFKFDDRVLIEEFIKGRELTVGILDDSPLPVIEIVPKKRFFDFEAKYQPGMTEYIVPAQLEKNTAERTRAVARQAHRLLGCVGCSRIDMILTADNKVYILEVNTIPGLTSTSLLPKAAKCIGIEFAGLCLKLLACSRR